MSARSVRVDGLGGSGDGRKSFGGKKQKRKRKVKLR